MYNFGLSEVKFTGFFRVDWPVKRKFIFEKAGKLLQDWIIIDSFWNDNQWFFSNNSQKKIFFKMIEPLQYWTIYSFWVHLIQITQELAYIFIEQWRAPILS